MTETKQYHLYVLLCDDKILYTGIAIDPDVRLQQHRQGAPLGAKFTRRFADLKKIYQVAVGDRAKAQSIEIKFKKLNRQDKLKLIRQQADLNDLLAVLD